jgi:hypothetical protein
VLLGLAIAAFAAVGAKADGVDPIDPTVIIRRVDPPPIIITSPNQTFNLIATATENVFAFQNQTGKTLNALTLDLFGVNINLLFSCGSFAGGDIFASCSSTQEGNGHYLVSFSGVGNGFTGITPAICSGGNGDDDNQGDNDDQGEGQTCVDGVYSLEFDGIPAGAVVRGTGSFVATPEPMTAVLLLGGLAGIAGLRKRRNS